MLTGYLSHRAIDYSSGHPEGGMSQIPYDIHISLLCFDFLSLYHIEGFVQDCSDSNALAMELLQSCAKPSIWCKWTLATYLPVANRVTSYTNPFLCFLIWVHGPLLLIEISWTSIGIMTWVNKYIHVKQGVVILHPCPNFHGGSIRALVTNCIPHNAPGVVNYPRPVNRHYMSVKRNPARKGLSCGIFHVVCELIMKGIGKTERCLAPSQYNDGLSMNGIFFIKIRQWEFLYR